MQFHFGSPPLVPGFEPDATGWKQLREPSPVMLQVIAIPVAIVTAVLLVNAWGSLPRAATPLFTITGGSDPPPGQFAVFALLAITGFAAFVFVHEVIHALAMPDFGITALTKIGVWPAKLVCYAAHLGPMSRNRMLAVFAAPFLVITLAPLVVCLLLQRNQELLATLSIVNGVCACGDICGFVMIAWQIPRKAQVQNHGWQTYWQPAGKRLPESATGGPAADDHLSKRGSTAT